MVYKKIIHIDIGELVDLGIPSNISNEQLNNSGYTYRFNPHKERLKKQLLKHLADKVTFCIRHEPIGINVEATLKIEPVGN